MLHLQHFTQCIRIPHSSTHTYILSWTGKPSNTETLSCYTYNILPSVHIPHSSTHTYILSWTGKPSNTETSSCYTYNILPSVYAFPTAVLIHIYFPELHGKPSNTETLSCYTLQHFTQCTHSPQQYSYIYTFLNWQAFKHWNFIMLHLQHFTQCICIPHSSTHTYILSWTGKPSNTETLSCYTYNILPSVRIPHSSTHTYILSWTGKPSNTETSSCYTYNILPSVYTHSPHHCSMASLQNYEHFHTLWINLQNITNSFKTYTLECVIHLTFLNNPKKILKKHFRSICKVLMPQQIFISIKMFTKFHGSLKLTFVDVHFNDPNSHFWMSLKITQTNIY